MLLQIGVDLERPGKIRAVGVGPENVHCLAGELFGSAALPSHLVQVRRYGEGPLLRAPISHFLVVEERQSVQLDSFADVVQQGLLSCPIVEDGAFSAEVEKVEMRLQLPEVIDSLTVAPHRRGSPSRFGCELNQTIYVFGSAGVMDQTGRSSTGLRIRDRASPGNCSRGATDTGQKKHRWLHTEWASSETQRIR